MARPRTVSRSALPSKDYVAPALEKGLDILELIAEQKGGLTQSQIAAALRRSIHEIYRMLSSLERRGYIYRSRPGDLYFLSMRTFEIAHRHEPTRGLLEIALPEMRRIADQTEQSCNLGIPSAGRVLIVDQVESPAPFGFSVRVGAHFPMLPNAAGRVLLAFQDDDVQRAWMRADGASDLTDRERADLARSLRQIRSRGYAEVQDKTFSGVTISYPLLGGYGHALAALTVPYVSSISFKTRPLSEVRARLHTAAAAISARLSGAAATRFGAPDPK
jgi:DNA-binding IclR family transcriptional regulator